jgi:hypothetical protein
MRAVAIIESGSTGAALRLLTVAGAAQVEPRTRIDVRSWSPVSRFTATVLPGRRSTLTHEV